MKTLFAPLYLARGALFLVAVIVLWWSWDSVKAFITAPVQTQLDVSRANNQGFKASTDAQNKGVDALKSEADTKKAKSEAAVATAGQVQFKRAKEIQAAPAVGETDYDRAMNRIDRELNLR